MKKVLSLFLVIVLMILLAGCKNDDTKVIKFAAQNDNTPATQKVIDAFNESQDDYKVEFVEMTNDSGQMHDQLLNSLSAKSDEYDVISMDVVWAGEFAAAGYLEALDTNMSDDDLAKADYNSGSMASGYYMGKQYSLPFFPDLGLLYIRKDIVSATDLTKLESGDYTYQELLDMSEAYVGDKDTEYGFVYQSKQYEGLTVNLTEFTNSFTDIKVGLEMMLAFTNSTSSPEDLLSYDEGKTHTAFEQGKAVFERNWPYAYGRIKGEEDGVTIDLDQLSVAPLPNGGSVGGWLLGMNENSEQKDGAWEFIKFLSGSEGQKIMSTEGGYLPGYNDLLTDEEVLAANEMLSFTGFQNALGSTISRPVSADYQALTDTVQIAAHGYLSNGDGIDTVVAIIENELGIENE